MITITTTNVVTKPTKPITPPIIANTKEEEADDNDNDDDDANDDDCSIISLFDVVVDVAVDVNIGCFWSFVVIIVVVDNDAEDKVEFFVIIDVIEFIVDETEIVASVTKGKEEDVDDDDDLHALLLHSSHRHAPPFRMQFFESLTFCIDAKVSLNVI